MLEKLTNWLGNTGIAALNSILPCLLIVIVGMIIVRIVMTVINKALEKSKLEKAAHSLIKSVARVGMYALLVLMAASALGIDVTGVVAIASVASLALSLALQNSLTNLIGGFVLLYTHPFSSGDYVEVAGQAGTVQEIGMAYTKLTTPDNKLVSIPNSSVVSAEIVNYTVTGTRRVEVTLTAPYVTPVEDVLKALNEVADVSYALPEQGKFVAVTKYGPNGIDYTCRIWTKTEEYWDAWFLMNRRVNEIFQREDMKLVYPCINVHMEK